MAKNYGPHDPVWKEEVDAKVNSMIKDLKSLMIK